MKIIFYFFLLIGLITCKRELTREKHEKLHQDSINQIILAMGINPDSSFSYNKYNKKLKNRNNTDSLIRIVSPSFAEHQFIFYNDTLTYYYFNEFPYDKMCGTGAINDFEDKKITELYKVKKKDLINIKSDTIEHFIQKLETKNSNEGFYPFALILAINKDSIKSKSLNQLRKYLINKNYRYNFRPLSTRERLVANAKFNNTSDDFSKINWDSVYYVDFKKFYPNN